MDSNFTSQMCREKATTILGEKIKLHFGMPNAANWKEVLENFGIKKLEFPNL